MSLIAKCCSRRLLTLVALILILLSARSAAASPGFVYALQQVNGGANQIYGFHLDPISGALTLLPGFPVASGGTGGSGSFSEHIAYNRGLLYVANSGSGSISVFLVSPGTGALTAAPYSPVVLGGNLACVAASPTSYAVVVGSNAGLWGLLLTPAGVAIAAGSPVSTSGGLPFSCVFSRDGNYAYTGGDIGSVIVGFAVTPATGALTALPGSPFDTTAVFPAGYATDSAGRLFASNITGGVRAFTTASGVPSAVTGNPFTSGLTAGVMGVVNSLGYYVVADRSNKIGVFKINGSGAATTLTAVAGSPFASGGSFTDAVAATTDSGLIVAANGSSRNLSVFSMNAGTGVLTNLVVQPVNSVGASGLITGVTWAPQATVPGDFDGDGVTDPAVYRPGNGTWYILKSSTATGDSHTWGLSTDLPQQGDFDGDGKQDPTFFRPSTGQWAVLKSSTNYTTAIVVTWGSSTDTLVPADYDGDGKTDMAIYRPSNGTWYILKSSTNFTAAVSYVWGLSTDIPVPGDYDGDAKADVAVYRPSTGVWFILKSSTNYTAAVTYTWGTSADLPIVADFDGDGKSDLGLYRASLGYWFVLKSSANYAAAFSAAWGAPSDIPVPGDYDGDGNADVAVYRPSTGAFYVLKSSTNFLAFDWGAVGDIAVLRQP